MDPLLIVFAALLGYVVFRLTKLIQQSAEANGYDMGYDDGFKDGEQSEKTQVLTKDNYSPPK